MFQQYPTHIWDGHNHINARCLAYLYSLYLYLYLGEARCHETRVGQSCRVLQASAAYGPDLSQARPGG